jgi:PKD repeat protein
MYRRLQNSNLFSSSLRLRLALFAMLSLAACAVSMLVVPVYSANPASGTISEATPLTTWTGQIKPATGSADCGGANNAGCENFQLTIQPPSTPTPTATPTPSATPTPPAGVPQYINYYPPAGVAEDFGEPSIGANWKSGKIMFFGGFSPYALRVGFNDSTSPATVSWDQTQLRLAGPQRVAGDPILFTDRVTGRTFVSQLFGLTPFNGMDMTDDDGANYLPSQGSGIGSGIDHQTIASGPFHTPIPTGATYSHAVCYCAQDGLNSNDTGIANCAMSIDGGLTFGPAVPVYALSYNECFPLHGHMKIAPDGTAYLPNRKCGAGAGLVLSEDNGITWSARTVPNSTVGDSDASLGIATDGTLFLGYEGSNGHAYISVSRDKGSTWTNPYDVGTQAGLQNAIFPAVVAGDGGENARAAFAFYGSTSPGDQDDPAYRGDWYLYISSTFDGGKTWTTVNATPGDPMQRDGICTRGFQGCAVPRNLLDFFDATVDKEGRVLVGYQDGCMGACVQSGPNSNTTKGVIARQSAGKRMFAQYDSSNPTPTPTPTATPTPTPTPGLITPVYEKGGITFSPNVALRAPVTGRDGEPSLRVDKFGNAYIAGIRGVPAGVDLWYVDLNPNSTTYDPLMRNPIYRGQPDQFSPDESIELGADGGGDVDLAVGFDEATPGNPPYLAFSSLTAANISSARSTDLGATFTKNPLGNVTGGVPADDRQWMEAYGKNTVYLLYRTLAPVIAYVQRSDDGGLTYGPATQVGSIGQVGGISVDQNDGTVYVSGSNGVVAVGTPAGPGQAPSSYTIRTVGGGAHIFFTVKAAKDGTVYVCYSDGRTVFIKYSKDKGATWSPAVRVSDGPETATSILPWIETGPTPGSVGVVWYGTTASSNNDNSDWKVFFAQSLNATTSSPVFRQVELSDHFIHGSNISESGLPVIPGNAPNRNLLDYFQIAFDPTGAAVVAYTDDHNDFDGHTYVARQISGPSVNGGDVPAPVNGSALPQSTPRPIDAPQVIDFSQDHKNGLLTVLPVNDPLDILSVKYSTEGPATAPVLVATMKVSDLSVVPPLSNWRMNFTANAPDSRLSGTGDYSFGLSDRGDQFFLQATTDATGCRTYTYGTAVREHQHRGFIAYTDRGTADSGAFDSAAGTITIKIALSKLNATLAAGHAPIGPGSILAGLRGGTFTTGDDNAADRNDRAKSDITRGGVLYAINSAPTALLSAVPSSGSAPLTVAFDGSGSTDPDPGDTLSYTFNFGDGSAAVTQSSPTISHIYNTAGNYTASLKIKDANGWESNTSSLTITVTAPQPPVVTCYDDNDSHIAYSSGWHLVDNNNASGKHFRLHNGKDATHFAALTFDVPSGQTGSLTYTYAKSTKGGSAQVFIDGISQSVISYNGPNGGLRDPEFSNGGVPYSIKYVGLAPGQHTFELRNLTDSVYFDGICVESASSSSQPLTGPGQTSSNSGSISAGQQSTSSMSAPANTNEISVLAEASGGLPIKLLLVDPAGLTLQTVDSVNGIAVLNTPVNKSGLYTVKVINVSLGPVKVWTAATPLVRR